MLPADMPCNQRFVLALVRESFGIPSDFPEPDNIAEIAEMIVWNDILLTVYPTLKLLVKKHSGNGYDAASMLIKRLHSSLLSAIRVATIQEYEGKKVIESLSRAGLDCIALKGWELRNYYPERLMRQMCDLDILIRPFNRIDVNAVMSSLGFAKCGGDSWKHHTFKKDVLYVEIHKRLTENVSNQKEWECTIWEKALEQQRHIFKMCNDDFYIFHFIHLYNDFKVGNLIIRRIVDTWLLKKTVNNWDYVNRILNDLGLLLFHERMINLAAACMGDSDFDSNSKYLLNYSLKDSVSRKIKLYKAVRIQSMSGGKSMWLGKLKSFTAAIFLPFHRMKAHYPLLKKVPILLPYFWIKRIFSLLSGNTKKYRQMLDYSDIDKSDYETAKRFLRAGGIENK